MFTPNHNTTTITVTTTTTGLAPTRRCSPAAKALLFDAQVPQNGPPVAEHG